MRASGDRGRPRRATPTNPEETPPDPLLDPARLTAYLRTHHLDPLQRLGQHFLVDMEVLDDMVRASETDPDIPTIEIGAGLGVLTRVLAQRREQAAGGRRQDMAPLIAVELDRRLVPLLRDRMKEFRSVRVLHGDILKMSWNEIFSATAYRLPPTAYDVLGNIPYNITAPIFRKFLAPTFARNRGASRELKNDGGTPRSLGEGEQASVGVADHSEMPSSGAPPRPRRLTFLVDEAVAQAIAAEPPRLSIRAISVQVFANPRIVRDRIPPSAFIPQPAVPSAILALSSRPRPLISAGDEHKFFRLVRAGFSQKRKTLANALAASYRIPRADMERSLRAAGIEPHRRAQTLSINEWRALLKHFA